MAHPSSPVAFPGGLSLEKWQAKGQDVHSLIADPKFVDLIPDQNTWANYCEAFAAEEA